MILFKLYIKRFWHSHSIMSWISLGIRLGGIFILLPLVLNRLSSEEVSVWLLFFSISSLMLLADFGFSQTFARDISYGFAGQTLSSLHGEETTIHNKNISEQDLLDKFDQPNWETLSALYNAMHWAYLRLALGAFLVIAIFGSFAVITPIERTPSPQENYVAWLFVLLGSTVTVYGYSLNAFLLGANKISEQKRWESIIHFTGLLAQCIAILLGAGLLEIVIISQVTIAVQVTINLFLVKKIFANFKIANSAASNKKIIYHMWPTIWRSAIGIFTSIGVMQGSIIVIANVLPSAEAASVQLAVRIIQTISQFSQVPFYTKLPEMNKRRAKNDIIGLAEIAQKGMKISFWILVVCGIFFGLFSFNILEAINSQTPFVSSQFWSILLLAYFFERYGAMHIQIYSTTRIIIWHIANGVTSFIWIILILTLMPKIGSLSLPISMFFSYLFFYSWYSAIFSYKSLPKISRIKFEISTSVIPFFILIAYILIKIDK